jgi:FlaA1/EpsC-like NDP-sugar epimerase
MTGTLGTALAEYHHAEGDQVFGCARNEAKACEWVNTHREIGTLLVADCIDLARPHTDLSRLLPSVDRLYHCAAMKHVDICEKQPAEAMHQNVTVTDHVFSACKAAGVQAVFAGSDKACLPSGVYGATKLIAEKVVLRYGGAAMRLGNLLGSSGSVFQKWRKAVDEGRSIEVTNPNMTRFFITVSEAARFMAQIVEPGYVSIPVVKSVRMGDVAAKIAPDYKITGLRPGETLHQLLVSDEERFTWSPSHLTLSSRGEALGPITSSHANRWNTRELLKAAGINR